MVWIKLISLAVGAAYRAVFKDELIAMTRARPYYLAVDHAASERIVNDTSLPAESYDTLEIARRMAIDGTIGTYRLNGQLNPKQVMIFEKGGRHIETIIGGFPEEEYYRILAEQKRTGRDSVNIATSFSWNSAKMR